MSTNIKLLICLLALSGFGMAGTLYTGSHVTSENCQAINENRATIRSILRHGKSLRIKERHEGVTKAEVAEYYDKAIASLPPRKC